VRSEDGHDAICVRESISRPGVTTGCGTIPVGGESVIQPQKQRVAEDRDRRVARFVGCNWGFYPGVGPILFTDPAIYLSVENLGIFIKPGLELSALRSTSIRGASGWQAVRRFVLGHSPAHGLVTLPTNCPDVQRTGTHVGAHLYDRNQKAVQLRRRSHCLFCLSQKGTFAL
jgi:hypothetical protein